MNSLIDINQILTPFDAESLVKNSTDKTVLIYKHSPTCSVSLYAKTQFEKFLREHDGSLNLNWVDVIHSRAASQKLAQLTSIPHESPQILLVSQGSCLWNTSHANITFESLVEQTAQSKGSAR